MKRKKKILQCTISREFAKELEKKYGKKIYTKCKGKRNPIIVD